jgi:hypothetical protein
LSFCIFESMTTFTSASIMPLAGGPKSVAHRAFGRARQSVAAQRERRAAAAHRAPAAACPHPPPLPPPWPTCVRPEGKERVQFSHDSRFEAKASGGCRAARSATAPTTDRVARAFRQPATHETVHAAAARAAWLCARAPVPWLPCACTRWRASATCPRCAWAP